MVDAIAVRVALHPVAVLAAAALLAPVALGQAPVYRCSDADGRTTFQQQPCPGGQVVDADGGQADPKAVERLERDLDAFRAREAARRAQNARDDELARLEADRRRLENELAAARAREAERASWNDAGYWGGWNWVAPVPPAPPPRPTPPLRPPRPPSVIVPNLGR